MGRALSGPLVFQSLMKLLEQDGPLIETPTHADDRRIAVRYVVQVPLRYKWRDRPEWYSGTTANISATGVLFELDTADPRIVTRPEMTPTFDA